MTRYVYVGAPHGPWEEDGPDDCPPPFRHEAIVVPPPHVVRKVVVSPPPRIEVAAPNLPPCTLRGGVNTDWASSNCAALHADAVQPILPARPAHPSQAGPLSPPLAPAPQPPSAPQASHAPQLSPAPHLAPATPPASVPQVSAQPQSTAPKVTAQVAQPAQPADQPARHSVVAELGWGLAFIIAVLLLRRPVRAMVAAARRWSAREAERREAVRLAELTPEEFASRMTRRDEEIDELSRYSQRLSEQADELSGSNFLARWRGERLRRRAARYLERVGAERDEVARLKSRWEEIEAARRDPGQAVKDKSVHELLDLLGSDDETANRALLQLYVRGGWLKWEDMIPHELPADVRARLLKICRVINGTLSLGEARAALAQARRVLKAHNIAWERMAA
ncbi:MAG: hypothetical protein JOY90_25025 [Bradyrhizobium sp.]|uniref:hypothetical protein n=1 Tax=Bradyrhizobium sp. TaxID=376 RepID=UPI001D382372|nr:hypothetical protein [Bradyrhizobium sp.]MBV9563677.1 hypothetical protein [Bradyrhizobium sp.]